MSEVRAAPKREVVVDWWVSPWGGGAATVVIGNAPGRVRWLSHRRWTGGVEGGAVEERTQHTDVYWRDGAKSGTGDGTHPLDHVGRNGFMFGGV
jgi:hypothetical protein